MILAWPWILLLLPLPLWWSYRSAPPPDETAAAPALPPRLQTALTGLAATRASGRWRRQWLHWCCWSLLLLALAQPGRPGEAEIQPASGRAMVLAIDLSSSMERRDFRLDGKPVERLTLVKQLAGHFILQRSGDRVGLVLFGEQAFIASAPSYDLKAVDEALQSAGVGMAGRSTAIGDALGLAVNSLRTDPAQDKVIVLLSDGTSNAGSVEPEAAARLAGSLGIPVHTLGLASEAGQSGVPAGRDLAADLDTDTLQAIADTAGGRFFRATDTDSLGRIFAVIDQLGRTEARAPPLIPRQDLGWVPLLLLLVLLLVQAAAPVAYRRPQTRPAGRERS